MTRELSLKTLYGEGVGEQTPLKEQRRGGGHNPSRNRGEGWCLGVHVIDTGPLRDTGPILSA